jgi:DNA-binding NarL/FixJ family response regulator
MEVPSPARIRILLLDDHVLFAQGLARLIAPEPDLELVRHCSSIDEAVPVLTRKEADLLLLDVDLGRSRGPDLLVRLNPAAAGIKVLVLTAGVTEADIGLLFQLGASGICFKDQPIETLARAIRAVMAGEAWMDQRCLAALVRPARAAAEVGPPNPFNDRERQVLRAVFNGLANKEISARLHMSESAVKGILQQLFDKTGVRTRSQLVRIVLEQHRDLV